MGEFGYLCQNIGCHEELVKAEDGRLYCPVCEEEKFRKPCNHKNETPFQTNIRLKCDICGKIYYHDPTPLDWDKIRGRKGSV